VPRYAAPLRAHAFAADTRFVARNSAPVKPSVITANSAPLRGPSASPRYASPRNRVVDVQSVGSVAPSGRLDSRSSRTASPAARTAESPSAPGQTLSRPDGRAMSSRVVRPRSETAADPRSSAVLPARDRTDPVSRATPSEPSEGRTAGSRIITPRTDPARQTPEERRLAVTPSREFGGLPSGRAAVSREPAQEPANARPTFGRLPQSPSPGRIEQDQPRPGSTSAPSRSRVASPAPRSAPEPSARPASQPPPDSGRPSRVGSERPAERAPSPPPSRNESAGGSGEGRAQARRR
jgi:hypothetical protein